MIKLAIGAAWRWIRGEAGWLGLLAVAIAAAAIYVHVRQITNDRDQLLAFAQRTCASAGQSFDTATIDSTDTKGKKRPVHYDRGVLCERRVADLAKFRTDAATQSAQILATAAGDHLKRAGADRVAATANDQARATADRNMEATNGKVQDDRVADDWFSALGNVAGVR